MRLESDFVFQASRQEVWDILQDPEVLVTAVPGTKKLDKISEEEYVGDMHVQIGPLSGVFHGRVVLSDRVEPQSYNMLIDTKGTLGFGKGTGRVELIAQDDCTTLMKYVVDLQIGGKMASLGQRLLETVGKSLSRQSLEALNNAICARKSGQKVEAPTQGKFAIAVGKDLLTRMFTPRRIAVVLIIILIILLAIWYATK